jgi:chorismate mutase/prephenate dehydratase
MSLEELRSSVDDIDGQIIKLIGERFRLAEEIGRVKGSNNLAVQDAERERTVMDRVKELGRRAGISESETAAIYHELISAARRRQESLTLAFQGESGAYSEEAAYMFFGATVKVKPCESFDDVFKSVSAETARYGILPIENSLEGSIARSYDLLLNSNLSVCGELKLKIEHQLIAAAGVKLDDVRLFQFPALLFIGMPGCIPQRVDSDPRVPVGHRSYSLNYVAVPRIVDESLRHPPLENLNHLLGRIRRELDLNRVES